MTVKKITNLRIRGDRALAWWEQRESDTGEAIDSMERSYYAGYVDALNEALALLHESSKGGRSAR